MILKTAFIYTQLILLFGMSWMPRFDAGQWQKIPAVFAHYHLHQNNSDGLNFAEYLSHHFWDFSEHSDTHDHSELPFYQGGHSVFFLPFHLTEWKPDYQIITTDPTVGFYLRHYDSLFVTSLLKPPLA